jgi:hypothetical protein
MMAKKDFGIEKNCHVFVAVGTGYAFIARLVV